MKKEIKTISYNIKKMIKTIKREQFFDVDRGLAKLYDAYKYFVKYDYKNTSNTILKLIGVLKRSSPNMEEVLYKLNTINKNIDRIMEKVKEMEIRHARSLIKYHATLSSKINSGYVSEEIKKYDIIYAPTQGGGHMSVVCAIDDKGMALCYPITTASENDLLMLGNKSWKIRDCPIELFNGNRLSSSTTMIDTKKAGYFKKYHLYQHDEIDQAMLYFQKEGYV